MFFKSPKAQDAILQKAMKSVERMLKEMQNEGKDISQLKLKKFQKTHHISCKCSKCKKADDKQDPRLRGLREYGFKVYVGETDEEQLH